MSLRSNALNLYYTYFKDRAGSGPARQMVNLLKRADRDLLSLRYALAKPIPALLEPSISSIKLSLTSNCNLRCKGCLYGRTFMPGECLDFDAIKRLLDDAAALKIPRIHFYGGEPMLHPHITEMIAYARDLGIYPSLGSNAMALNQRNVDDLYAAGLRAINVGLYGVDDAYDDYVGRKQRFPLLTKNLSYIRETYPDVDVTFAWLLMRPTCSVEAVREVAALADKLKVSFGVILLQYDFPYFTEGENGHLQLLEDDRPALEAVSGELLRLKRQRPDLISTSVAALAAIPDWVVKKGTNNVPCYMDDNLFILPNGDVLVCPKMASIGNIDAGRLMDVVGTDSHKRAVRDCFELNCPGCHFRYEMRTEHHRPSRIHYEPIGTVGAA